MNEGEVKDVKTMAKDAKKRLKSGFWQSYKSDVVHFVQKAKEEGVNSSKVVEYYESQISQNNNLNSSRDLFYQKVKNLLECEGEVNDPIGRLIDEEFFNDLSYSAKQKYLLELSENYREAVERFYREQKFLNGFVRK